MRHSCCYLHEASVLFDSGSIPCWILWDLNGLLHGSQQTIPALSSQGRTKALRSTDEQTHHNIGILLHALPCEIRGSNVSDRTPQNYKCNHGMTVPTINKDSKAEEIQVSLSSTWVPANVRVALRKEHWTHLQTTACQVCHHLYHHATSKRECKVSPLYTFMCFSFL